MSVTPFPMFPLGTVLLPGGLLPLHVFEPRYRTLVEHCMASSEGFGVVLIARGHEVGGGDERTGIGTRVQLVQVARVGGGRYALLCAGVERIRVREWCPDAPYPRALIEDWPDVHDAAVPNRWWSPDGGVTENHHALVQRVRAVAALALELGDHGPSPAQELAEHPVRRSYDLVDLAPLGPSDRHALLAAAGPVERLDDLDAMLGDLEAVLRFRLGEDPSPPISPEAW